MATGAGDVARTAPGGVHGQGAVEDAEGPATAVDDVRRQGRRPRVRGESRRRRLPHRVLRGRLRSRGARPLGSPARVRGQGEPRLRRPLDRDRRRSRRRPVRTRRAARARPAVSALRLAPDPSATGLARLGRAGRGLPRLVGLELRRRQPRVGIPEHPPADAGGGASSRSGPRGLDGLQALCLRRSGATRPGRQWPPHRPPPKPVFAGLDAARSGVRLPSPGRRDRTPCFARGDDRGCRSARTQRRLRARGPVRRGRPGRVRRVDELSAIRRGRFVPPSFNDELGAWWVLPRRYHA